MLQLRLFKSVVAAAHVLLTLVLSVNLETLEIWLKTYKSMSSISMASSVGATLYFPATLSGFTVLGVYPGA